MAGKREIQNDNSGGGNNNISTGKNVINGSSISVYFIISYLP